MIHNLKSFLKTQAFTWKQGEKAGDGNANTNFPTGIKIPENAFITGYYIEVIEDAIGNLPTSDLSFQISNSGNSVVLMDSAPGSFQYIRGQSNTVFNNSDQSLKYCAYLTQAGVAAPVATIIKNTLGTITYSYVSPGTYKVNMGGVDPTKGFPTGRTFFYCTINVTANTATLCNTVEMSRGDANNLYIQTFLQRFDVPTQEMTRVISDALLTAAPAENCPIEIEVFTGLNAINPISDGSELNFKIFSPVPDKFISGKINFHLFYMQQ